MPYFNQGRMTMDMISRSVAMKVMWLSWDLNLQPLDLYYGAWLALKGYVPIYNKRQWQFATESTDTQGKNCLQFKYITIAGSELV